MDLHIRADPARARALSTEVNTRLLASLRYVFDEAGRQLNVDVVAVSEWLDRLAIAHRPKPLIHALFHALVRHIENADLKTACEIAKLLLGLEPAATSDEFHIVSFDDDCLGLGACALYRQFADTEEDNRLDLIRPDASEIGRFRPTFDQSLALLAENDTELLGEFRALVGDVVLVAQGPQSRFALGALSCFETWGALFFNASAQRDALELVGTIAHECTHLLLFALALDEPLVLNNREERYYSPLRDQMRTMDGIFHATLVAARMTRAFLCQAEATTRPIAFREMAINRAKGGFSYFDRGVEAIRKDGSLSARGETLLENAIVAMDDARAYVPVREASTVVISSP